MNDKTYEYEAFIQSAADTVCCIVGIRKDIRAKIGKQGSDLVKVKITERK